ncbi:HDOD domain-containing protein [Shewanella cyperi]|uniref:HDOD domain-containing protein n=1 Tax=Shewanella cyperi TaxID=2814292 RepID=A0A974XMQ9_9GAMM|nr:HDOD domain-containing protein [Shewanella cyperi]QSX30118.1 HDOD domain-containing protein [Shewanella cyperi]
MKFFRKLFNLREKTIVERPVSFSEPAVAQKYQQDLQRASSHQQQQQTEVTDVTLDVAALFYSLLFAVTSKDTSGVANNLERRVIADVEQGLADPQKVAEDVLRLPGKVLELDRMLADPAVETPEVIATIQQDPVLCAEVLKLCNSPAFHRGEKHITSLQQAVVVLGRAQLRRFVSSVLLREMIEIKPIYFRRFGAEIWRHSMQVAFLASELANEDKDTAFLLGLLHDVGKIAIFQMLVAEFVKADPSEQPKSWLFRQIMTSKSLVLSALLVKCWQLPPPFSRVLAVLAQSDAVPESDVARAIWRANWLSECSMLWQAKRLSEPMLQQLLQRLEVDRASFDALHEKLLNFK